MESLAPLVLFGWDDLLVIVDRPEAFEELRDAAGQVVGRRPVNTWYAVVVRSGEVLGEAVAYNGTLITRKNVTALLSVPLPPGYDGVWWFPGQSTPP